MREFQGCTGVYSDDSLLQTVLRRTRFNVIIQKCWTWNFYSYYDAMLTSSSLYWDRKTYKIITAYINRKIWLYCYKLSYLLGLRLGIMLLWSVSHNFIRGKTYPPNQRHFQEPATTSNLLLFNYITVTIKNNHYTKILDITLKMSTYTKIPWI